MAANSQQFVTIKNDHVPKKNSEMAVGNGQTTKACGICAVMGHATDMCPTLQEGSTEQVGRIIPLSDMETLQYTNLTIKLIGHNVLKFQRLETRASIQQLNAQMGQLETSINRLEALNSNSLPSQTMVNPKENVNAITLKSGKKLKVNEEVVKEPVQNKDVQESKVEEDETVQMDAPRALKESRKDERINGLYEVFRRFEVNIHLLDAIKQVPRYAKFLKELCTVKRKQKLKGCQKVELREQVSAVIQRKVPKKCKDPGRPFLKTSKSNIDVNNDTLTMEFDTDVVKFHIFDTLQILDCESVVNNFNVINHLSQEHKNVVNEYKVKEVIARPIENFTAESFCSDLQVPRKSKQRKKRPKITAKLRKWVKVVR
ncbi:uncharacterized protein [Henckelia pumila]|uniref:uncharacterized protein n=1 Tax=Henckelia pumila TaxID=405737 RepID=UPI003C6E0268